LGACLALRGVEGCVPLLHGSQGCATYIRRYVISHFREPLDVASSNFAEATAVFGGGDNLRIALENVVRQYRPALVGIATTCLAETIGEDVPGLVRQIRGQAAVPLPEIVCVSTPAYAGTHVEGFHATVRALVQSLAQDGVPDGSVNVLPGIVSPADLRALKTWCADFGLTVNLLVDYSDPLDGPIWTEYQRIPPGGTPLDVIRRAGRARATIELSGAPRHGPSAGQWLEQQFGVPCHELPLPVGVRATDRLFDLLGRLGGRPMPDVYAQQRGRLLDAYVDAHKYVSGKRAVVFGDQDLVLGLAALAAEIGVAPVCCASGAETGRLAQRLDLVMEDSSLEYAAAEAVDFEEIEEIAVRKQPDLLIGSSKGYRLARRLEKPLVRVGFPIHDRIDAARIQHLGYAGAQQLFDRIANALIAQAQDASPVGYPYM
jgi:nitrogenase molybdenum-iron protein NifN